MSWFSNLVHKFEHVLRHVGAIAGDVLAASFGFPPGAGFAAVELLMHAHAGDPHARAKVARLSQNPKMRAYLQEVARHLRAHPHYATFRDHAEHPHHVAPPPTRGVPSAPLPPDAYGHLAPHPHTAGLTSHSMWNAGGPEVGRAQIVGEDPFSVGRAQIVGADDRMGAGRPYTGHAPHPHRQHHPGHGSQAYGVEWLLEEEDALDRLTASEDGDPEEWRTERAPRGTPGV
jgi:hypothetical protein